MRIGKWCCYPRFALNVSWTYPYHPPHLRVEEVGNIHHNKDNRVHCKDTTWCTHMYYRSKNKMTKWVKLWNWRPPVKIPDQNTRPKIPDWLFHRGFWLVFFFEQVKICGQAFGLVFHLSVWYFLPWYGSGTVKYKKPDQKWAQFWTAYTPPTKLDNKCVKANTITASIKSEIRGVS